MSGQRSVAPQRCNLSVHLLGCCSAYAMHSFPRLDLTDRSHVFIPERPSTGVGSRAARGEYASPPGFPAGGLLAARPARRAAATESASRKTAAALRADQEVARREKMQKDYMAAWSDAFSPGRSLFTSGFMMWMAGNSVHVFSIMSVFTVVFMQFKALFGVFATFKRVVRRNPDLKGRLGGHVVLYLALCLFGVVGALYKCQLLGLLPTEEGDWVALLPAETPSLPIRGGMAF